MSVSYFMAQSQKSFKEGLLLLADHLSERKEDILDDWVQSLENEEQESKLISLSREKFIDHIPFIIDRLCEILRQEEKSAEIMAKKHGIERWEFGFDLREITREWGKLHQVLMIYINLSKDKYPLSPEVLGEAQKVTTILIHESILNSIDGYYNMQKQKAEAQIRELETALQEKEESQMQGKYIRQTTHDVKGILYSLKSGFSMLEKEKFNGKNADLIEELSLAADSLNRLLDDLLSLFKLEANQEEKKITSFALSELLQDLCGSLKPLAQSRALDFRCSGDESLTVEGDAGKIERIAQNLIVNSFKYTEEGYVEVNWQARDEGEWQLTVKDTGPGMGSSDASDGNSITSGEGIGLLIVRQLCQLLDAVIDMESAPQTGTTFKIVFPSTYSSSPTS